MDETISLDKCFTCLKTNQIFWRSDGLYESEAAQAASSNFLLHIKPERIRGTGME